MAQEQQAQAKEVASSSDDQQKSDRDSVICVQVHVLHCQSITKNMLVKGGGITTRSGKRETVARRLEISTLPIYCS